MTGCQISLVRAVGLEFGPEVWLSLVGALRNRWLQTPAGGFEVDNNARNATAKPLVVPEIVTLPGEIDVTNAQSIGDGLQAACGPGVAVVIADMTGTAFLDSSGIRCLLLASEHAAKANAELRLVTGSAAVLRVLAITGVDGLFKIYPNLQAALTNPRLAGAREAPGDG
jgi:anti-sigma B factor antagonist